VGSDAFPRYFQLLAAWLLDASGKVPIPEGHPIHDIKANPSGPSHPDVFVLCTSEESATFAGMMGVGMVFAEFIARTEGGPAIAAYRKAFQPSEFRSEPWAGTAVVAYAAETEEQAWREDSLRRAATVSMLSGRRQRFTSIEAAEDFLSHFERSPLLGDVVGRTIAGTGGAVRERLEAKARNSDAQEVFVMATGPSLEQRIASLELIKAA
jgi:alkanesulfonate monooxygenase SsuD/methylene tetrahydromethanopterin reductase-like flavin-dependent oxidoreductase (luciferase family)